MLQLVLDAWAVMAWLVDQQPACEQVQLWFDAVNRGECKLFMNIVNLGEVFYSSVKAKNLIYGEQVVSAISPHIVNVSADDELVMRAATLKAAHAISYADAFAAATAMILELPLATGEPELRTMAKKEKKLKLEWLAE